MTELIYHLALIPDAMYCASKLPASDQDQLLSTPAPTSANGLKDALNGNLASIQEESEETKEEPKLDITEAKDKGKEETKREAIGEPNDNVKDDAKESEDHKGANGTAIHINGKVQEDSGSSGDPASSDGHKEPAQNGTEDHGIVRKKTAIVSTEGDKAEGEASQEIGELPVGDAEPRKDAAELNIEAVESNKEAAEPGKGSTQAEKPATMSLSSHLVALWNKVASELSATNLTPGDILDGARFLLALPPVNLGSTGVESVKDDIF